MKKIILIATAAWITLASCTKEASSPLTDDKIDNNESSAQSIKAIVEWMGDPALDGLGWVLRTSKDNVEVPRNLPTEFKKNGIEVLVTFKRTTEKVPCRCSPDRYYVDITSIQYLNP